MIRGIVKKFFNFLKVNTPFGGSCVAVIYSLADAWFNLKLTFIHVFHYYFNNKILKFSKLNVGCGTDLKDGFCNIDFGKKADACFDVRNRMPFLNRSIDVVYSSHFVEHLEHSDLIFHFQECYRMLRDNGVLRMAIPDFAASMQAYLNNDTNRLELVKNRFKLNPPSGIPEELLVYMDYLDRSVHEYGTHKQLLDFEKVKNMLVFSGFLPDQICLVEFDPSIDLETRKDCSFFVEAKR